jgi:cytochrome c oxidase subunit 4
MGRKATLLRPLLTWAALVGLGLVSLGYALLPGMPGKLGVSLAVVVMQVSLILGAFMKLGRSSALVRVTALVGAVWLSFLFLMSFADLLTR